MWKKWKKFFKNFSSERYSFLWTIFSEKSDSFESEEKGLVSNATFKDVQYSRSNFVLLRRTNTKLAKFSWIVFPRCDNNETRIVTNAEFLLAEENRNLFPARWIASLTKMCDLLMKKLESPIVSRYNVKQFCMNETLIVWNYTIYLRKFRIIKFQIYNGWKIWLRNNFI